METRYKKRRLCERDINIQAASKAITCISPAALKQLEHTSNTKSSEQSSSSLITTDLTQASHDVENGENEENNNNRKHKDETREVSCTVPGGGGGDGHINDATVCIDVKSSKDSDLSKCHISLGVDIQSDLTTAGEDDDASRYVRLFFTTEYMEDIVEHEFEKDKQFHLSDEYCFKYDIDADRREILIDWLISVQIHFKARNNTLHLAVNLLDTLLDRIRVPCRLLQVSAAAAFWVAYKVIHGNLSVKALERLCPQSLTKETILHHEILVLESSRLLDTGGDVDVFYNYILFRVFGSAYPPEVYYCCQYLLDVMLVDFWFVDFGAAEKSYAAARASVDAFAPRLRNRMPDPKRFVTELKLEIAVGRLVQMLRVKYEAASELRRCQVYKKYNTPRYHKISSNQTLKEYIFGFPS